MIDHDYKLMASYVFAATCLTAVIVFQDHNASNDVASQIAGLRYEVNQLNKDFCERVNAMHRLRGFEVLDCENNTVMVEQAERYLRAKLENQQ